MTEQEMIEEALRKNPPHPQTGNGLPVEEESEGQQ